MENDEEIKKLTSKIELITKRVESIEHQLRHHIGDIDPHVHEIGNV